MFTQSELFEKYVIKGMTGPEIAKEASCCTRTVYNYLEKYEIERRPRRGTPKKGHAKRVLNPETLRQLYIKENKSARSVAKELGVGRSSVLSYLKVFGIRIREQKEAASQARLGVKASPETRKKISKNHARISGEQHAMYGVQKFGSDNSAWKGGVNELNNSIRSLKEYVKWRMCVFQRDKFTCLHCGDASGGNLQADHLIPLSYLIKKYGISSTEEALDCKEIWDVANGRTLCLTCHKGTDTWGPGANHYASDH